MTKVQKLKTALSAVLIVLASVYLTFLIDSYTLNTFLKRAFIFCYFVVMSIVACYLYGKIRNHKLTVIPLVCSIILLALCQNVFLPTDGEKTVSISASEISSGTVFKEVWLVGIESDGNNVNLSRLELEKSTGWAYSGEYDDYYFAPLGNSEADKSNALTFTVVGNEIKFVFGKNEWSGNVSVTDENGNTETVSLSSDESDETTAVYLLETSKSYSSTERILYNAGATVVLTFAFKLIFVALIRVRNKRKKD